TRRLLAAGQAAYIAVLGCWLGITAGIVPGVAAAGPLTDEPPDSGAGPGHGVVIDVPWTSLLLVGVIVPLIAALVAGASTRAKPSMTRAAA
ncbi:hypothetical protein, partial [Actinomadura sp. LOL_011]